MRIQIRKIGKVIVVAVSWILIIFGISCLGAAISEDDWYTYVIASVLLISIGSITLWVVQRNTTKKCPKCRTPYKGNLKVCQKCGAPLRKPRSMPWQNAVAIVCSFSIFFVGLIFLIFAIFDHDRSFFLMFGAPFAIIGGIPLWILIRHDINRCPKCGTPYKGKVDTCQKCGTPRRKSVTPIPVRPATPIYKTAFGCILGSVGCLIISSPYYFGIAGVCGVIVGIIERDLTVGLIGGASLILAGAGYFWLSKTDLP